MPDLGPRIAKSIRMESSDPKWRVARAILGVCAIEVLVFSIIDVFGPTHADRHLGSFSMAFGVVLIGVVLRPSRARMMLPVAAVLALSLAISAVVDVLSGSVPLLTEARHIPELVSVVMLWLLAAPVRDRSGARRRPVRWTPTVVTEKRESA